MSLVKKTILGLIGNRVFAEAVIFSTRKISESFQLLEIDSESFKGLTWRPGEKIQINVGEWLVRTYTPLALDSTSGRMTILAYLHGSGDDRGAGSRWAAGAVPGDHCQVMGPRRSLDLSGSSGRGILFGDETSLAVAATVRKFAQNRSVSENGMKSSSMNTDFEFVFEVSNLQQMKPALEFLGLTDASLFLRMPEETHFFKIAQKIRARFVRDPDSELIMTGRAQSIQALRKDLVEQNIPSVQVKTKAYWSVGKQGLD